MDEQNQIQDDMENSSKTPPDLSADGQTETPGPDSGNVEAQMPPMDFAKPEAKPAAPSNPDDMNEADAEAMMLKMMEESAAEQTSAPSPAAPPVVERAAFEQFKSEGKAQPKNIEMLMDITLPVSIELGRTSMKIEDVLNLGPGSVVELDKLAGEPVDLLVNDKMLAKGEVVVIDENFGVRITAMVSLQDRIKSLK